MSAISRWCWGGAVLQGGTGGSGPSSLQLQRCGEYLQPSLEGLLKPLVQRRLLPQLQRWGPGIAPSGASIRQELLGIAIAEIHIDTPAVAWIRLDDGPAGGGLLVQPAPPRRSRRLLRMRRGDLAMHQFDLAVSPLLCPGTL
ncbi:hypothetical protein AK812_SmicGene15845 [Symbiodinium microadriaticum]|uniref:Uncharacterized protein n=1 Tax=Symbiodinium microadriaticum TaxID=2951 RepID=A0A1Q9E1W8_SYMMI|nr:hypothetical protein AK812_SmicGene15845 [Symbiodinium microadriaticum]